MVSERDVMGQVAISEDVVVRSDDGRFAVTGGAMDRDVFAESVVIADLSARHAAIPFQILGLEANARKRENLVAFTERCQPVDNHMRVKPALVAEHYVLADDAIGTDLAIGSDLCARMNDGGGMDHNASFIHQDKGDLRFADYLSVHQTDALGLADLPARFSQFHLDHQRVTRTHRLAPLDLLRGHEIGKLPGVLGLPERENPGDLS